MKNKYAKNLWLLMLPLIGSNILQQLYNTIDSIIISRFTNALNFAAVGVASSVMNLFFFLLIGACTGISVLFSQSYGKKDMDTFHRIFFQSLVFGTLASVLLAIFGIVGLPMILSLIDVPTHLVPLTKTYLIVIFIALPATYLYNICSALMRSIGHSKTVLIILMISVLANTGLDLFLVAYWKQGIFGAAFATALSQCVSAILSLWTIKHRFSWLMFTRKDCIFDRKMLYLILSMASVTALHQSSLYIGKLMVQGIVNGQGAMTIAGFTAATRIEGFANSFGDSGCAATSVFIAQSFGAKKMDDAQNYYKNSFHSMMALGLVCSAIMYVFASPLCGLMTSGVALQSAVSYLQMISLFYI
ncbi:MAG: MATE family efflux transporter, partial [Bacillota bacterium]